VARTDSSTGAPTYYAIKAYGNVVSGFFSQETVNIGDFKRFRRQELKANNISEIISIKDAQGNEYFEVGYLSQDIVFKELTNANFKNDNVPSVLKPFIVSRKFVAVQEKTRTFLQFGSGEAGQSNVAADPQKVALNIFGKSYVTDTTFDPSKLSKNQNFGIVPANTTLTIIYRVTNPTNSNVGVGSLNTVSSNRMNFKDRADLTNTTVQDVINSLEVSNEEPIVGNVSLPTTGEIKRRIYDTFPTQDRAVTQADYENLTYRMPAKFGSIKKVSVQRDPDSNKRNLNLYVISEDNFGKLTATNSTIKNNLKIWLNNFRMLNDTIDILDPFILNIGIDFVITTTVGANKFDVLEKAMAQLKSKYAAPYNIGEQFYISEVYQELKKVTGVLDVVKVKLNSKQGGNYGAASIDINGNLSPDGSYLMVPKNAILEIKFPEVDIRGKIR